MADDRDRAPARHYARVATAVLGFAGLVVLTFAVLTGPAPSPSASRPSARSSSSSPTSSLSGPRTLVALGDSVPSADTCGCAGYVEQIGGRLHVLTHHQWVVHNDATSGWATADVRNDLSAPATRADLAQADLVLIEVGANDFDVSRVDDPVCVPAASSACWTSDLEGLRTGLTQITDGIHQIDGRPDLRIVFIGYWNVTVDGAVGRALGPDFVSGSDALTHLVNATVEQVAARTGADYVDAYTPFKGDTDTRDPTSDLLEDGDHLNAAGHALLASNVVDTLTRIGLVEGWTEDKG